MRFAILCTIICAVTFTVLNAQQQPASLLECNCGSASPTSTTLSAQEAQMRRGIAAYIVLRGQRFGGQFGEPVGAGTGAITGGFSLPLFPERIGSIAQGGGVSVTTANQYGVVIGPFKAGLPTSATIIAEIVDVFGDVVQSESGSLAILRLGALDSAQAGNFFETRPVYYPGGNLQYRYLPNVQIVNRQNLQARSQNGRFEWEGVNIGGIAGTTLTLTVQHSSLPTCGCAVQISLQGGYPDNCVFARLNTPMQPAAAPGRIGGQVGAVPHIIINETVSFSNANAEFNSITVLLRDRFNNFASFPTTATLSIGVDKIKSTVLGDIAGSRLEWGLGRNGNEVLSRNSSVIVSASLESRRQNLAGRISPALEGRGMGYAPINHPQLARHIATFSNLKIIGATANNVSLVVSIPPDPTLETLRVGGDFRNTSSTVNVFPAPAVAITPVIIADIFNQNRPNRMPSRFYTRLSNRNDPRMWFFLQAVDEFGNRADGGPNAYNGGLATITFQSPELGLPRASGFAANTFYTPQGFQFSFSNDRFVKVNAQRYNATGTSAVAVNGLYTFNNFMPRDPASLDPMGNDVVLTFEDPNLLGVIPCTNCPSASGRPIYPPITTATTTFLALPIVSLVIPENGQVGAATNGAVRVADNALLLREKAPTLYANDRRLEAGSVRIERSVTAVSNDVAVGYTLRYVSIDSNARTTPTIPSFERTPRTFALPNVGNNSPLQLPVPIAISPESFFRLPLPTPSPVRINGLQGDLSPVIAQTQRLERNADVATEDRLGTFFIDAGIAQGRMNFTARWSDQVWHRTPARQGLRAAVLKIFDPDRINATLYEVDTTSAKDSAFVYLLDPTEIPPVIMNAIQDKVMLRPSGNTPIEDRIELESPRWRFDGVPGFVIYDDNYDPLTYTVSSEDPTQVSARVLQSDPIFQGRPSLYYAVQPGAKVGASVRIRVVASESGLVNAQQAVDEFIVKVVGTVDVATQVETASMKLFPNPIGISTNEVSVQFQLPIASDVRLELLSMQGVKMLATNIGFVTSGHHQYIMPLNNIPSGIYVLKLLAQNHVKTAFMTIIR